MWATHSSIGYYFKNTPDRFSFTWHFQTFLVCCNTNNKISHISSTGYCNSWDKANIEIELFNAIFPYSSTLEPPVTFKIENAGVKSAMNYDIMNLWHVLNWEW